MNYTKDAYCRLCAELKPHNVLVNLQTDAEMCDKIVSKLSRFNIVMDLDGFILPKTVCFLCTKSLDRAFNFVTAVERAQVALSDFVLIQINASESNMKDENIFVESPEEGKELAIKSENNFSGTMDVKNEDSDINVHSEGYANVKINPTVDETPNLKNEDDVNVKDESISYTSPELNNDDTNASNGDDTMIKNIDNKPLNLNNEDDNIYDMDVSNDNAIINKEKNMSVEPSKVNNDNDKNKKGKLNNKKQNRTKSNSKDSNSKPLENAEYTTDFINKQINRCATVPFPLQHIKETWMDFCWKCSICETQFPNINELRNHSMEYHNTCNPYTCHDCNAQKVRLDAFIKHVRTHRKYLHYSCYVCFKKFSNPHGMRLHKYTHKDSDYICTGCNTNFKSKHELNKHVTTFYKNMWKKKVPDKLQNDNLTCTICNKTCKTPNGLRYHLATHTERKRDQICEICGKGFYHITHLKNHMIIHSDVKLYQCEICKHSFKNMSQLRYHANVHSGIKPFTCNECGKSFRLKINLASHLETHSDTLPHTCTYCNKGFRRHSYLLNHLLQHTGVRPYSCEICPRDFTNWANWHKHMNRKHGIETAKKKHTPRGPHAVDAATGKVIYPESDKFHEWKKKMIQQKNKPGPKIKKTGKVEICQEKLVANESVVEISLPM